MAGVLWVLCGLRAGLDWLIETLDPTPSPWAALVELDPDLPD